MKRTVFRALFLVFLSLVARPLDAQEAERDDPLVVSVNELVLDRYVVQNVNEDMLLETAMELVGRRYFVKEHGPGASPISNLRQIGGTLVLYDTQEQVQRVRVFLEKLDVSPYEQQSYEVQTMEYKPRFLSLQAANEALEARVDVYIPEERGVLILSGSEEDLAQAMVYMKTVDIPQKQVLLSCLLLEVGQGEAETVVPKELLENLQQLLPGSEFSLAGMALLQTSVSSRRQISLQIESPGKRYRFGCSPQAFDEETGSLTVANCNLIEETSSGTRVLFETSTVLRGGEYTVLAATGATTRLLVVRILPQD